MRAVGIQEGAGDIDDRLASPVEYKAGLLRDNGDGSRLKILFRGVSEELVLVFRRYDNGHSLLGFGDRKLCAVETFIFLGNQVQIDTQAVCQLSDRDGHAARAEVVALLDEAGDLGPSEQSLEFALCRSISLLDFRSAVCQGLVVVSLGRSCSAAHAVTACASAQKDDDIARIAVLALYILAGSGAHDSADLHALGHIAGMIDLLDVTGGQTDLVAVAGVALGCSHDELLLGKLVLKCIGYRHGGIGGAGHAHSLVYISSSGERVADRAAEACGSAAEGLDLCGMVVGLVLEEYEPLFCDGAVSVVHFHGDDNGTGVVLIGLFLVCELAVSFQLLHAHERQVHQADELVVSAFIEFLSGVEIAQIGGLDNISVIAVLELDVAKLCREGRVAAVIRPIGVENTDLRDRGIPVLCPGKILLDEQEVIKRHGKSQGLVELCELILIHRCHAGEDLHVIRLGILGLQRLGFVHAGLSGINRVDAVFFDPVDLFLSERSGKDIGLRRSDDGILIFIQELHALHRAVSSLIELSGKGLHAENEAVFRYINGLSVENVYGRLRKNGPAGFLKDLV